MKFHPANEQNDLDALVYAYEQEEKSFSFDSRSKMTNKVSEFIESSG